MRSTPSLRTVSEGLPLKQFYFGIVRGGPVSAFVHQSCTFVHQSCAFVPSRAQVLFTNRVLFFFGVTYMILLTCLERLRFFRVNENTPVTEECWEVTNTYVNSCAFIFFIFLSVVCLFFMANYDFSLHNQTNNYTIHVPAHLATE